MKYILYFTLIFLVIFSTDTLAQGKRSDNKGSVIEITEIATNGFTLSITINDIDFKKEKLNGQSFIGLYIDDFGKSLDIGNPQLPVLKRLMELPEDANYKIEILEQTSKLLNLNSSKHFDFIKPAQASILKVENPNVVFMMNKQTYNADKDFELDLVKITPLGKMRSNSLARLEVSPVKYNPVSNTIEYISKLVIRVHITDFDAQKLKVEKQKYHSPYFNVHNQSIINSSAYELSSKVVYNNQYPYKYVIVADSMFKANLQPFVRWKEKKGFKVIEAYLQDPAVGNTTTSIKAYLQGLYNSATPTNPAPTYVLFVGDVAQLPAWPSTTGGYHVSDLHYCEFTNDFFPEMMYGRFSANDTSELSPQIQKTIEYETYAMADPSFLGNTVLISGYDGSGHAPTYGDGQINYGVAEYFNNSNSTNCFSYLYVNGSYNKDNEIFQKINSGVSIANYTAHGAIDGWADPTFKVANVANMTNDGKYPLMIGNACITNHFDSPVCFGEGLMRAKNKGAIGYIGASDNTYWDEDYYWAVGYVAISTNPTYNATSPGLYDKMFHTHNEPYSDWAMSSFQYLLAGNMAVTQAGSSVNYYYEIYHLMGDPSLMAYQKVPAQITATYTPFIVTGTTTFQVNTVAHALVAISQNDTLITSIMSDANGVAILPLGSSFSKTGIIDLVITAQNYEPYFQTVFGGSPTGPYVISSNFVIDDNSANNNSLADFGEAILLDVDFANLTSFGSNGSSATLLSSDTQIVITQNAVNIGNMLAYDTISKDDAFALSVIPNAADNHAVHLDIQITNTAGDTWVTPIIIPLYAPEIIIGEVRVKDTLQGAGNGLIESGEEVIIQIKMINSGSRDALNVVCNYTSMSNKVIVDNAYTINNLESNSYEWVNFKVSFAPSLFDGSFANLVFDYVSGAYVGTQDFPMVVGLCDEDFETGNFSRFDWDTTSTNTWYIDTNVYEGSYSIRSKEALADGESSSISLNMNVLASGPLSFYTKVSTESGYDLLNFKVDGNIKGSWSGNEPWTQQSYEIDAGNHTFIWEYSKDYMYTENLDAVWIDYIIFPPTDAWTVIRDNKEPLLSEIKLWPNPATNNVNIVVKTLIKTDISISVYNQLGQIVIDNTDFGNYIQGEVSMTLNTSKLKSGVYIVRIIAKDQQYYQKLIIE